MNFTELEKQLKQGKLSPIYLIEGADDYIHSVVKKAFLSLIPDDQKVMNVGTYDLENVDIGVALDDASSAPFFGDYRLVFIDNPVFLSGERTKIKFNLDGLQSYIDNPEQTTILVFNAMYEKLDGRKKIVKDLKKKAQVIDAAAPNEAQTRKIIQNLTSKNGLTISNDALEELIYRTDNNLGRAINELEKLSIYAAAEKNIDVEAVDNLVVKNLNQNVFDLINVLMKGDLKQSIEEYRALLLNQEQPLRINAALLGQFRLLLQVKILLNRGFSQGQLAQFLKVHPYRIKLAMQTVKRFDFDILKKGFLGLVSLEKQLKTTQRDPTELFELFVVKLKKQW